MRYYDLTYLIAPGLDEHTANELAQECISSLQDKGAILGKSNTPVRTSLAYPISGKQSAYMAIVTFYLPDPEQVDTIKQEFKENENVLRYLLIQSEDGDSEHNGDTETEGRETTDKEEYPRERVELKDVEKKLDEILE